MHTTAGAQKGKGEETRQRAGSASRLGAGVGSASKIAQLQRRYGNQRLQQLVLARHDALQLAGEEENGGCTCGRAVQREMSPDDEEPVCREVQREPEAPGRLPGPLQTKLGVSSPEDAAEIEAEQVAHEVTSFEAGLGSAGLDASLLSRLNVPRVMGIGGVSPMSFQSVPLTSRKPSVFADAAPGASDPETVAPDVEARIMQSRGDGQPLSAHVHNLMSLRTGHDFSAVRVKTGPEAAELSDKLHARAFTLGSDIWLGKNESPDDVHLMAHELTHVVQQGAARPMSPVTTAGTDALKEKSGVVSYLQALSRGKSRDAALYRKEIDNFRSSNSRDAIDALHDQILERPSTKDAATRDGSTVMRDCGCSGGPGSGGSAPPCAVPTNFRETLRRRDAGGVLHFEYAWDSSTGSLADLGSCEVGEIVTYSQTEDPPFIPAPNPTVLWVPGTDGVAQDNHSPGVRKPYKDSTEIAVQYYRFHCPCRDSDRPVNLMGPITLTRKVESTGSGNFKYTITKSGISNTIDPLP